MVSLGPYGIAEERNLNMLFIAQEPLGGRQIHRVLDLLENASKGDPKVFQGDATATHRRPMVPPKVLQGDSNLIRN